MSQFDFLCLCFLCINGGGRGWCEGGSVGHGCGRQEVVIVVLMVVGVDIGIVVLVVVKISLR